MRRPIIGVAWTAVLIAAIVIISAQTRSGGGGVAAAAGEDRFSAGLEQVFAGAALWFVLLPAAVTTGRARSTAAGFAVLGLGVVAVASIYGGASFGGLALLVMGALALFTPRIVLAAERRESDPDEVEV
jgi:uncharacterized membrane protein